MASLRSPETEVKYKKHRADRAGKTDCELCEKETLKKFNFWRIVPNIFPYDTVAEEHNMLIPLRHIASKELNEEEKNELQNLKETFLGQNYDFVLEQMPKNMTLPTHFHLHLIQLKKSL